MDLHEALNSFIGRVAGEEGGKTEARIGDIRQITRLINKNTNGALYPIIHAIEEAAVTGQPKQLEGDRPVRNDSDLAVGPGPKPE